MSLAVCLLHEEGALPDLGQWDMAKRQHSPTQAPHSAVASGQPEAHQSC